MTARRATRDDVARLAGTSSAVVSYVVNGGPRKVSTELSSRVRSAMLSLDYVPNALARSLSGSRTRTVGMIVPNISNAYFSELALAVETATAACGQLLFLGNSNEDKARELAYVRNFVERRVDGIVIIGVARSTTIDAARRAGVPVVVVDRDLGRQDVPTVGIDHHEAGRLATEHLIEHGHTRIACLAGPMDQPVAEERTAGWRSALAAAGIDAGRLPVIRSAFSLAGGRAAADAIVTSRAAGVTAVFVSTDDQARGLLAGCRDLGVEVPDALAVTSIDGTREGSQVSPGLTSVQQPYDALAEAAVAAMTDLDLGHTRIGTRLIIGRSCGCHSNRKD